MNIKNIFKTKKKTQKEIKKENCSIGMEETISNIVTGLDFTDKTLDEFLEIFFRTDSYYILELIKTPETSKVYIEIIDDYISAVVFTSKRKAMNYINTELKEIENGTNGTISIQQRCPQKIFDDIIELKKNNVERILFNYPTEWISFNIK